MRGYLPVAENDKLVGMITDRDIAIRAVAKGKGPDSKVSEVMSKEVKYCYEDDEVENVLKDIGDIQVRRLPVMNQDKRLVGIASLSDLAANGDADAASSTFCKISRHGGAHCQTL